MTIKIANNVRRLPGHSAAYTNFIARTTGLDATHLTAYATLFDGLTTDGLFNSDGSSSKLDVLYILATQDSTTSLLNLVSASYPATLHQSGGHELVFTQDRGWQSDGNGSYILTGFIPSTAGGNWTQDGCSLGVYDGSTPDLAYQIGTGAGIATLQTHISAGQAGANLLRVNTGAGDFILAGTITAGHYIGVRTASNAYVLYKNAASVGTDAAASTGNPSVEFYVFGSNNGSDAVTGITSDQLAAAHIGGSLTPTNVTNLSSHINAYMTTVGANVY